MLGASSQMKSARTMTETIVDRAARGEIHISRRVSSLATFFLPLRYRRKCRHYIQWSLEAERKEPCILEYELMLTDEDTLQIELL